MTTTVLVRAGAPESLAAALDALGFLALESVPWRFSSGSERRWIGPGGTRVVWADYSYLGRRAVRVEPGREAAEVEAAVAAQLDVADGAALVRAWQGALAAGEGGATLEAFLDFAAWAAVADPEESALLRTPVFHAALDAPDPVLRLAALRNLYVFTPDRAVALLAGRTDEDNPGLALWRRHYAGLKGG